MNDKHVFEETSVTGGTTGINWLEDEAEWQKFKTACDTLGFNVRATGGAFLTHEIDGSKEDFEVILDLME